MTTPDPLSPKGPEQEPSEERPLFAAGDPDDVHPMTWNDIKRIGSELEKATPRVYEPSYHIHPPAWGTEPRPDVCVICACHKP